MGREKEPDGLVNNEVISIDENAYLSGLYDLLHRRLDKNDDVEWADIVDYMNDHNSAGFTYTREFVRKAYPLLALFDNAGWVRRPDAGSEETASPDADQEGTAARLRALHAERMKLQTEKLEFNRWLREYARDELLIEKILDAMREHEPLRVPEPLPVSHNSKAGVLLFGDEHFGAEFEIHGLHGETLNKYSVEIAEERMWDLLYKTVEIVRKEGLSELDVFNMGDFTDGILRVGQLMKLQYGVVDSTVIYMEFLANWLNKLTEYVHVNFQMVHGNHSELRLLGQKKGAFKDENMGKIVASYIKARLADNPNFHFIDNPTGLIYATVAGFHLLGVHGECKNMASALREFASIYNTEINFLCGGHLHHSASENVGYNMETIRVPSLIGADPFSMSLNQVSNAGATLLMLEEDVGKTAEYFIHLN